MRERIRISLVPAGGSSEHDESFEWEFEQAIAATDVRIDQGERQHSLTQNWADFFVEISPFALPGIAALSGVLGAWLQARLGRKVGVKIGDIEAYASTVEEVERLLEMAKAFRANDQAP